MNYFALKKRILSNISYNYLFLSAETVIEPNIYISLIDNTPTPFVVFVGSESSIDTLFNFLSPTAFEASLDFDAVVDAVFTFYNASSFSVHMINFIDADAILNVLASEIAQVNFDEFITSETNAVALQSGVLAPTSLDEKLNLYIDVIAYTYIIFTVFFEEVFNVTALAQYNSSIKFVIDFNESLGTVTDATYVDVTYMEINFDDDLNIIATLNSSSIQAFLVAVLSGANINVEFVFKSKTNYRISLTTLANSYFKLKSSATKKIKTNLLSEDESTMRFMMQILILLLRYDTQQLIDMDNLTLDELSIEII